MDWDSDQQKLSSWFIMVRKFEILKELNGSPTPCFYVKSSWSMVFQWNKKDMDQPNKKDMDPPCCKMISF